MPWICAFFFFFYVLNTYPTPMRICSWICPEYKTTILVELPGSYPKPSFGFKIRRVRIPKGRLWRIAYVDEIP
ncbi:hypothetical protein BGX38DRAFT_1191785 [Terfezia claveryi]|nr:hypothetical protein BGX38DRAFT_1191785 [Terfezia claveryi]